MTRYDELRELAARADAIAAALLLMVDEVGIDGQPDRESLERVACLVGISADAAARTLTAIDASNADVVHPSIPSIPDSDPAAWDDPVDRGHRDIKRVGAIVTSAEAALSVAASKGMTIEEAIANGVGQSIAGNATMAIAAIEDRR
jgi:hypothetical protein